MSPERPPSQDSGGGNNNKNSNNNNNSVNVIDSANMVLSAVPLESGHVVIQQQQHRIISQQATTNGINSFTQIHRNSPPSVITKPIVSTTATSPSKCIFFQQNGIGHYTTNDSTTTTYITQQNSVGNIVLVKTEPMEINSEQMSVNTNGADEELTSLTWLHDKNLIKGIVACTNNKSVVASPARQSNGGGLSPTSDFLEDSCVSEDNASSANSSSDQGISVNSDYSPTGVQNGTFAIHQHHLPPSHFHPTHHHIQYANNNNNNSISKNRNHVLPNTATTLTSSTPASDHLMGATTTVHIGPSGTTTVVEYKSGNNFISSSSSSSRPTQLPAVPSSPQRLPSTNSNFVASSIPSPSPPTSSSASTNSHHQHFHKKYIREQLNGIEQNHQNGGGQFSPNKNYSITIFQPEQQGINVQEPKEFVHNTAIKQQQQQHQQQLQPPLTFLTNGVEESVKDNFDNSNARTQNAQKPMASPKQKHPTNVPYDPLVHTHNKPPYSFSSLIFMAIEDSPEKALPVKEIYAWIVQHFPYFKTAPTGWKNSVRHNLSLNKSFLKVEKAPNMGKGSLWRVEQQQRPNLIQALTRSPFFPCSVVDKLSPNKSPTPQPADSPPSTPTKSTLDARLFPKLSKMIKEMVTKGNGPDNATDTNETCPKVSYTVPAGASSSNNNNTSNSNNNVTNGNGEIFPADGGGPAMRSSVPQYEKNIERLARDCGADSIEDVNAATAMLALKHGPKVFTETFNNGSPVITSSPSEDHTYSAGGGCGGSSNNSNGASSDAAYESSEEGNTHNITAEELEEQRRHREGVDALLSFASKVSSMSSSAASSPIKRPASTSIEDEQLSSYAENIPSLGINCNGINEDEITNHQRQVFNPQTYYNHLLSPSPAKKLKAPKNLRAKIKRKATWMR